MVLFFQSLCNLLSFIDLMISRDLDREMKGKQNHHLLQINTATEQWSCWSFFFLLCRLNGTCRINSFLSWGNVSNSYLTIPSFQYIFKPQSKYTDFAIDAHICSHSFHILSLVLLSSPLYKTPLQNDLYHSEIVSHVSVLAFWRQSLELTIPLQSLRLYDWLKFKI